MTLFSNSGADLNELAQIKDMRVMIISDAAPERNGVGAYYQDLIQYLQPKVGKLEIICPIIQENGRWQGGLNIPLPGDTTQKFLIPNFWNIKKRVRQFAPDVVIVPTPGLIGLAGAFQGRKHGATVLLGFHTWFEKLADMYWGRIEGALNRAYFWVSNKLLFRWSDIVVANSDEMVQIANEFGSKQSFRVGTPVAFNFLNRPQADPVNKVARIMFAGRLAAEKNLPAIIEAARAHPDLEFSISGDGPERAHVEKAALELPNLRYLGWLNRDALLAQIDQHDCLVLPSHVESFGTIALESMARGRITVVSRNCGICQWPELNKGLFIIEPHSNLTDMISSLKSIDSKLLVQKTSMGRTAAEQLNNWSMGLWYSLLGSLNKK
ncbi:glycosyltransferase [Gynuella sunshinyii]|uniref:Glycosyltransferase n=1 Tax=Gynuella sunshinyii YC6258 TaxID=1445510 RepID=A0A0C5VM40_9GAMM|nr:glycosyltransferase [Gynuella sunshinyii]AJQ95376.1 glycosyltransferase [Gynuella sunshinyii YC6258]